MHAGAHDFPQPLQGFNETHYRLSLCQKPLTFSFFGTFMQISTIYDGLKGKKKKKKKNQYVPLIQCYSCNTSMNNCGGGGTTETKMRNKQY